MKKRYFLLLLFFSCSNFCNTQFAAPVLVDSGAGLLNVSHVLACDINHDNRPDLVTTHYGPASPAHVYLNNVNGFGASQLLQLTIDYPEQIHAADINGDGWPDLLTVSQTVSDLSWYPNVQGDFPVRHPIDTNLVAPFDLVAADIDNDGDSDLFAGGDQDILLYLNDGFGNFTLDSVPSLRMFGERYALCIADVNHDQLKDVLIGGTNGLTVFLNTGNTVFQPDSNYTHDLVFGVSVADLNHDSMPDVIVETSSQLMWFSNNGHGRLTYEQTLDPAYHPRNPVCTGDYNNDGYPDVCTFNGPGNVIVLYSNIAGVFSPAQTVYSDPSIILFTDALTTDLNNNGRDELIWSSVIPSVFYHPDLVSAVPEYEKNSLSVYPNPVNQFILLNVPVKIMKTAKVSLVTITGILVRDFDLRNRAELPVSGIEPGIYFLRIVSTESDKTYKVVVAGN